MSMLKVEPQIFLQKVYRIYQHPYNYTSIVHNMDNYIYLYDHNTMSMIGRSKITCSEAMKLFVFIPENINKFYGLSESKIILSFTLQDNGIISHRKLYFHPQSDNYSNNYLSSISLGYNNQLQQLLCLTHQNIIILDLQSQEIKSQENLRDKNGNNIYLKQAVLCYSQQQWIGISQHEVYLLRIYEQKYECVDMLSLSMQCMKLNVDTTCNGSYIAILMENSYTTICTYNKISLSYCYQFNLNPGCKISSITFFTLSVNTSTTNHYNDYIYLIFTTNNNSIATLGSNSMQEELQIDKQNQNLSSNLIIYQCLKNQFNSNINFEFNSIHNKKKYFISSIGNIQVYPWINLHYHNQIFYLKTNGQVCTFSLIGVISEKGGKNIGKEWVNLGYKFKPLSQNQVYEEFQDQFETEPNSIQQYTLNKNVLNDWSYSLIPINIIIQKNEHKCQLNCFQI